MSLVSHNKLRINTARQDAEERSKALPTELGKLIWDIAQAQSFPPSVSREVVRFLTESVMPDSWTALREDLATLGFRLEPNNDSLFDNPGKAVRAAYCIALVKKRSQAGRVIGILIGRNGSVEVEGIEPASAA